MYFKSHYLCPFTCYSVSPFSGYQHSQWRWCFFFFCLKNTEKKNASLLTSFLDNTAGIVARRSTFTRKDRTQYLLPVVVTDSGSPALSSTSTLTINVCSCQPADDCPTGGVKVLTLSMGVSLQTLLGLLVCLVTLTGKRAWCLYSHRISVLIYRYTVI